MRISPSSSPAQQTAAEMVLLPSASAKLNSIVRKLNSTGSSSSTTSIASSSWPESSGISSTTSSKLNLANNLAGSMTSMIEFDDDVDEEKKKAANKACSACSADAAAQQKPKKAVQQQQGGNPVVGAFSRRFLSPFSSTSSVFSSTNSSTNGSSNNAAASSSIMEFGGAQVRRISVPLHRAKNSLAGRRLSHFVQSVGDAVHQEIMVFNGEKPSDHFGKLDREWEVVTVRELCRRLSLEDSLEPSEMPLPEGALHSQVLDEFMIRQILDILPPRAEGYPWVNIYNSEKHGFSLSTLYRKMSEWKEEMSPVLLVLRDVAGHVFGAVTSTALRPCDHYYGTGDSCLLFRFTGEYPHTRELRTYNWTGNNQFFVNATRDFLSVGAGGGHYGLWLDADLNNGRSQKCATFDNEPLAGGLDEDFTIQFVEAWGFCMT